MKIAAPLDHNAMRLNLMRPFSRRELRKYYPKAIADQMFDELAAGLKRIGARQKDARLFFSTRENNVTVLRLYHTDNLSWPLASRHWPPGDASSSSAIVELIISDKPPRGLYESGEDYSRRVLRGDTSQPGASDPPRLAVYVNPDWAAD